MIGGRWELFYPNPRPGPFNRCRDWIGRNYVLPMAPIGGTMPDPTAPVWLSGRNEVRADSADGYEFGGQVEPGRGMCQCPDANPPDPGLRHRTYVLERNASGSLKFYVRCQLVA